MERDAIDLKTLNVFTLFSKYFVPTLLGMLGMSAVTAIDGIFVGQGVGSDGIAAVNISIPFVDDIYGRRIDDWGRMFSGCVDSICSW